MLLHVLLWSHAAQSLGGLRVCPQARFALQDLQKLLLIVCDLSENLDPMHACLKEGCWKQDGDRLEAQGTCWFVLKLDITRDHHHS